MGLVWRPMVTDMTKSNDNELITGGIFRLARHPIYLGLILFEVGLILIIESWLSTIALLAMPCWLVFFRIPREEALMRRQFGRQYDTYSRHVGMLGPCACACTTNDNDDTMRHGVDDKGFATCIDES
jgi:protein-S-isoprenylcysteine O-methyltransferase Ste14